MSPQAQIPAVRRLAVTLVGLAAVLGIALVPGGEATGSAFPSPVPKARCGDGDRPETGTQGRVPQSDYDSGRAARGYTCNTRQVARTGATGGFKVLRYTDEAGRTCAYYDSTLLFPKDVLLQAAQGLGVVVVDMSDPAHPVPTDQLTTPAMLSPHESLLVNAKRGLLGAVLGNAYANVGVLDLYDVSQDCRHPVLASSTDVALLGHESGWSRDGRTFYAASAGGQTFVAIDVSDPTAPERIFEQYGVNYHGLRLSDDGRTMYVANIGNPDAGATISTGGLRVLDVSQIQDRDPDPQVAVLADLTWPEHSIPQVAQPFTRDGRHYLLEVDEFANFGLLAGPTQASAPVGAARIIDVEDPTDPQVVSDLRLRVHQPDARLGDQANDPGAQMPVQGYAGHYCSAPYQRDPRIVACSMILSGLRVFDISDLERPREVAYFNRPTMPLSDPQNLTAQGAFAMSQPAWDVARRSIWYTDANKGLYVVRLVHGAQQLMKPAS